MPIQWVPMPYTIIDSDPHIGRVIRYMRPSDLATWAGATGGLPLFMWYMRKWNPTYSRGGFAKVGYHFGVIGFFSGFLVAQLAVTKRFWGMSENEREVKKDYEEMRGRIQQGEPLYGRSRLSEYAQGVAMRNSTWSQLHSVVFPWFNMVNHKFHNTEQDYYKGLEHLKPADYSAIY